MKLSLYTFADEAFVPGIAALINSARRHGFSGKIHVGSPEPLSILPCFTAVLSPRRPLLTSTLNTAADGPAPGGARRGCRLSRRPKQLFSRTATTARTISSRPFGVRRAFLWIAACPTPRLRANSIRPRSPSANGLVASVPKAWMACAIVGVHSVLRESLRFGNISVPGSDRMDNLPKVHI